MLKARLAKGTDKQADSVNAKAEKMKSSSLSVYMAVCLFAWLCEDASKRKDQKNMA